MSVATKTIHLQSTIYTACYSIEKNLTQAISNNKGKELFEIKIQLLTNCMLFQQVKRCICLIGTITQLSANSHATKLGPLCVDIWGRGERHQ